MATDQTSSRSGEDPTKKPDPHARSASMDSGSRRTRASAVWVATGAALVLLVLLIVFILQNPTRVEVQFFGVTGTLSVGMAMLIAAVGGGVLVAVAGVARVTQLRLSARRTRRLTPGT